MRTITELLRRKSKEPVILPADALGHRIEIIVPVYGGCPNLSSLLKLSSHFGPQARVTIVDTKSISGLSANSAAGKEGFRIVHAPGHGFGAACNAVGLSSPSEYLLFLNSDAFIEPESVEAMLNSIESTQYYAVGPTLNLCKYFEEKTRKTNYRWIRRIGRFCPYTRRAGCAGRKSESLLADLRERRISVLPTNFLNGSCFLVRADVFQDLAGFDGKRFPIGYGEETDFFLRLQSVSDCNAVCGITVNAHCDHLGSVSMVHFNIALLKAIGSARVVSRHGRDAYRARSDALEAFIASLETTRV